MFFFQKKTQNVTFFFWLAKRHVRVANKKKKKKIYWWMLHWIQRFGHQKNADGNTTSQTRVTIPYAGKYRYDVVCDLGDQTGCVMEVFLDQTLIHQETTDSTRMTCIGIINTSICNATLEFHIQNSHQPVLWNVHCTAIWNFLFFFQTKNKFRFHFGELQNTFLTKKIFGGVYVRRFFSSGKNTSQPTRSLQSFFKLIFF